MLSIMEPNKRNNIHTVEATNNPYRGCINTLETIGKDLEENHFESMLGLKQKELQENIIQFSIIGSIQSFMKGKDLNLSFNVLLFLSYRISITIV